MSAAERSSGLPIFNRAPRVPPLLIPLGALLLLIAAFVLFRGTPANPDAYWQIPLAMLVIIGIPSAIILPRTWAGVQVTAEGLFVRGRRVVPAGELGTVELLTGMRAYGAGVSARFLGARVPPRQNLYAGWADLGPVVAVEHRALTGQSTFWLLPGPRAKELAAALEAARATEHPEGRTDRRNRRRGTGETADE